MKYKFEKRVEYGLAGYTFCCWSNFKYKGKTKQVDAWKHYYNEKQKITEKMKKELIDIIKEEIKKFKKIK